MKDKNPYKDSLWVDYKSLSEPTETASSVSWPFPRKKHSAPAKRLRKLPTAAVRPKGISRRSVKAGAKANNRGAVRVQSRTNHSSGSVSQRLVTNLSGQLNARHLVLAGLAMAGGVALLANATTRSDKPSRFKSMVITQTQLPAPQPVFSFNDTEAAVSQNAVSQTAGALAANLSAMPSSQVFTPQGFASLLHEIESDQPQGTREEIVESTFTDPAIKTANSLLPDAFLDKKEEPGTEVAPTDTAQSKIEHSKTAALITQALVKAPELKENYRQTLVVAAGDTFSGLLNDQGIPKAQVNALLTNDIVKEHLSQLRIGTKLNFEYRWDGKLDNVSVKINRDTRVRLLNTDQELQVAKVHLPLEYERVVTSGTIEQSLYLAAEKADLKQSTIMELADIFEWELDFARDIRKGDHFSIVYDRLYRDGKYIGDGDILAAEFLRGDRRHSAIRFTDDNGVTEYYSPDGQSKRRTFMRHPVDVVRITSRFDPNRLHPVLHKIRAHKGVDYGAPHGSPIYATADGKVSFSGKKSAYGNTVILKHGDNRTTLYAHMSRIAKKSKVNTRVKRGDVIGYVGKTGRVTGTHLHYEFRIGGTHVDPLKVKFPNAKPLDKKYHARLKAISNELVAQMRSVLKKEQKVAIK